MKVLFLYSELMPNVLAMFRVMVKEFGVAVHVVHWDKRKMTPYVPPPIDGVKYYARSALDGPGLAALIADVSPEVIYVAGWMDGGYLRAVMKWRRAGVPVVAGFDDPWRGTLRQLVGSLLSPLLRWAFFSHAWVSWYRQYEMAKRLGFPDERIVCNLLSCDVDLFEASSQLSGGVHVSARPYFVFVGRFMPAKGIDVLRLGYEAYRGAVQTPWELVCVGNGPLESLLKGVEGIRVVPFANQEAVLAMMSGASAFVLASNKDFSPLVVHEACCSGLPLILSSAVGNRQTFLIEGYNGLVFESGKYVALGEAMATMHGMAESVRRAMMARSREMGRKVNPRMVAASFLSVVRSGLCSAPQEGQGG